MKNTLIKTASLAVLSLAAAFALAAELYSPNRAAKDQGMTLKSWGSGTIAETSEAIFDGVGSLRISSRNFFQGGIINYDTPVDLSKEFGDRNNLLLLAVQIPGATTGGAAGGNRGGGSGPPVGAGTGGVSGLGGGGQEPFDPQGGAAGASVPSSGGTSAGAAAASSDIKVLRFVISTSDGKKSEAYVNLDTTLPDAKGWRKVGIPLQAIRGFDKTNKMVSSIAVSTDTVGTVYIGAMNILNDATPVYAEPSSRDLNLAQGDEVVLSATGSAGATPLKFMWDFDSADGITVDAEGQAVRRRFRKPGEYTITVTAQDIYGLKAPHSSTIKVVVN